MENFEHNEKDINEFDLYLKKLIGSINLEDPNLNLEYIYNIENARLIQSQHAINSMIESISGERIMTMFNKETKGLRNFADIDALDLEILLNHLVLGVLTSIKNKNKMCLRHYTDKVLLSKNIDALNYNHSIIYSASYYDVEMNKLISERKNKISDLLVNNTPDDSLTNEIEERFLTFKNSK